jgi:hypothetical protein
MADAEVLEAFRVVTDWSDEQVLHYASCKACTPICGDEEYDCGTSPRTTERAALEALARRTRPVYISELPSACYRAEAGFIVHVASVCRCGR